MKLKNKVGMAYDICLENRKKFYIHLLAAFIFYSILIFLIYLIVDAYSYEYRINKSYIREASDRESEAHAGRND